MSCFQKNSLRFIIACPKKLAQTFLNLVLPDLEESRLRKRDPAKEKEVREAAEKAIKEIRSYGFEVCVSVCVCFFLFHMLLSRRYAPMALRCVSLCVLFFLFICCYQGDTHLCRWGVTFFFHILYCHVCVREIPPTYGFEVRLFWGCLHIYIYIYYSGVYRWDTHLPTAFSCRLFVFLTAVHYYCTLYAKFCMSGRLTFSVYLTFSVCWVFHCISPYLKS